MDATSRGEHSNPLKGNSISSSSGGEDDDQNSGKTTNSAVGRNPAILLALDSLHRSLLLKNLQFDQDPTADSSNNTNSRSSSNSATSSVSGSGGTCDEEDQRQYYYRYQSSEEEPLEEGVNKLMEQEERSGVVEVIQSHVQVDCPKYNPEEQQYTVLIDEPDKYTDVVDGGVQELLKVRRDRNNNETRVMMMVAKYESGKPGKFTVDETETSDFDTASVSSSSVASVQSSSAFSEVSQGVASMESLASKQEQQPTTVLGTGESHVVTAGAATITINIINKTAENCDTTTTSVPLKTGGPVMKAVQVQVPECESSEAESNVRAGVMTSEEEDTTGCESRDLYDSRAFQTAESQEFFTCNSYLNSNSNSPIGDKSSEGTLEPPEEESEDERRHNRTRVVCQQIIDDENEPMINIIQEMTQDMQVSSTVRVNKAKIKEHRENRSVEKRHKQKSEKRKLDNSHFSRQKIIDDNFCNEILDSTIHFDRLYGINRKSASSSVAAPAPVMEVLSDSALQPSSSAGDESFDSTMSYGKLEGKPRYSGRPVGRLMAKRLKKLSTKQNPTKSEPQSDSSTSNYANGPKKPPRTFASTKKSSKIGWIDDVERIKNASPDARNYPQLIDLDSDPDLMGWKFKKREKSHNIGWAVPKERKSESSIPPHIYNMLHYSDDDTRKRLIRTSNSKAVPQTCCHHAEHDELGPKLDIDTVDYPVEGRRRRTEFERFVADSRIKSTPHKRQQAVAKRTEQFLDAERGGTRSRRVSDTRRHTTAEFLQHERQEESKHFLADGRRTDHDPDPGISSSSFCPKCAEKSSKKSFRKAAVRRTKSFFEASKKKIHLQGLKKGPREKERFETPKKAEFDSNLNKENSVKKQLHKHLGYTPDHLRCGSCPKQCKTSRVHQAPVCSAPARLVEDKENVKPRLPARTVLNFSGSDVALAAVDEPDSKKQKVHEMKFLKTLKNLKISPKKLFKSHSQEPPKCQNPTQHSPREQGHFQSYDDLNLDNVAQMGDFLNNARLALEAERDPSREQMLDKICVARYAAAVENSAPLRNRLISTSSEFLDGQDQQHQQIQVCADLHREPIYQEISPKNNKTIINEFICEEFNSRRYMMANNNPDVLYAVVDKNRKNNANVKSGNSLEKDQQTNTVKKENVARMSAPKSNTPAGTPESHAAGRSSSSSSGKSRRSLFTNTKCGGEGVDGDLNRSMGADEENYISVLQDNGSSVGDELEKDAVCEEIIVKKEVARLNRPVRPYSSDMEYSEETEYRAFRTDIHRTNSGTMARGSLTCVEQLLKAAMAKELIGTAPLGRVDTDDELDIESLQKYQDKGLEELSKSLRENISISELETIDTESDAFVTGYDTVDFLSPPRRQHTGNSTIASSDNRNSSIDTDNVSELMTARDYSQSNISPITSSPTSSAKLRMNSSEMVRSIRDKLRLSFRRSKRFIKNEQKKLVNYFEEKPAKKESQATPTRGVVFDLEQYQRKYKDEKETEEIYQTLSSAGSLVELSNQFLAELVNQIKTQCDIKKQLKQALAICRNTREFECSSELIEAERLLLLSTLKETAARNYLSKIDYNSNGKVLNSGKKVGVVGLNHFEFPLKESAVNDMLFNYFYVVVCSYKNQVKATLARERFEDRVYFRNCEIKFHDLDAEYEIRVEVFVLRLRKNARNYSFESKYHLNKEAKSLLGSCPSPPKLRSPAKLLAGRSNSPKSFDFDNEFSRFKSQGYITLTSFSLLPSSSSHQINENEKLLESCRNSPYYSASSNFQQMVRQQGEYNIYLVEDFKYFKLDSMVYNSNLLGSMGMSIKSEVIFVNTDTSGFLTVGENRSGSIDWSRKWCKVNGFVLEFWNYPQECHEKLPTLLIDLTKCINDEVQLAERAVCSRPRTFRLDVFTKGTNSCSSSGISSYKDSDSQRNQQNAADGQQQLKEQQPICDNTKNYLLSADTPNELKMWLNELNRIVKFLKEWRI